VFAACARARSSDPRPVVSFAIPTAAGNCLTTCTASRVADRSTNQAPSRKSGAKLSAVMRATVVLPAPGAPTSVSGGGFAASQQPNDLRQFAIARDQRRQRFARTARSLCLLRCLRGHRPDASDESGCHVLSQRATRLRTPRRLGGGTSANTCSVEMHVHCAPHATPDTAGAPPRGISGSVPLVRCHAVTQRHSAPISTGLPGTFAGPPAPRTGAIALHIALW
jgi:hypothetical protein